jgi:hypothetical protein
MIINYYLNIAIRAAPAARNELTKAVVVAELIAALIAATFTVIIDSPATALADAINAFADIHFISISKEMEQEGFPSKVYTIMAGFQNYHMILTS